MFLSGMDSPALCVSLLLCAAVLGHPAPATDPHCAARCTLFGKISAAANSVGQKNDPDISSSGCSSDQMNQCLQCMESNSAKTHYSFCTSQCARHSSCQSVCDCSSPSDTISMSKAQGQKLKLLCKDANKAGAVLVLEFPFQSPPSRAQYRQEGALQWTPLKNLMSFTKWIRLENLKFFQRYEVQLFSEEDAAPLEGTFQTLASAHTLVQVREVFVANYVSGAGEALYANVSWIPAVDAVCCYSVYKANTDYDSCKPGQHWFAQHKVQLGEETNFMVRAYTSTSESTLNSINVKVPSCPDGITDSQGRPLPASSAYCKTGKVESMCGMESPGSQKGDIKIEATWTDELWSARAPPAEAYRLRLLGVNGELLSEASIEAPIHTWNAEVSGMRVKSGYNIEITIESSLGLGEKFTYRRRMKKGLNGYFNRNNCPPSVSWAQLMLQQNSQNSISDNVIPRAMPVVTAGAGVVVLTVCLAVVAFMSHKKRLSIKRRREEKSFGKFLEPMNRAEQFAEKAKIVSAPEVLRLGHKLGEGHFGIVYKAEMWQPEQKKWSVVAVKTLKGRVDETAREQFLQESALMKEVGRHSHIVGLLGEGELPHGGGRYMAVEFCERGDLLTLLRGHYLEERAYVNADHLSACPLEKATLVCNQGYGNIIDGKAPLTGLELMSFARQIAIGMEYLSSIRIVHRDLAARNVLVTADMQLKVADFGLSRDVYEGSIYFKHHGPASLPLRWMALEAIERSMYTTASDVWSFGVVLWEIWTLGKEPYAGLTGVQVLEALKQGHRLVKPDECPIDLYEIMLQCWSESPLSRPSFGSFRTSVESMIEGHSYLAVKDSHSDRKQGSGEDSPLLPASTSSEE